MSFWYKYNEKACADFIAENYHNLFSIPKKEFCSFLNCFSLTQLKDYQKHEKELKRSF